MYDAGLILEGGGMKGLYTSGVLDFFLDKELEFKNIYGVSAGACNMTGYVAKQRGRSRDIFTDYIDMKQYMGFYSFLTTGDFFGMDVSFDLIPNYINPFDYDKYREFTGNAYAVVTNIRTGEPEYVKIEDAYSQVDYLRASSSLPLISKIVHIKGQPYLDGGVSDSIPIKESERAGNVKNVVVMTKPIGFRRKPESKKMLAAIKVKYLRYPKVYELIKNRYIAYNECLDYVEKEAAEGKIFLIRPEHDLEISRTEKDKEKLLKLYDEGYEEAKKQYDALMEYLNK